MVQRLDNWRARLNMALDALREQELVWGQVDCVVGIAGFSVEAITGTDPTARWKGRYETMRGAIRVMRNDGFADISELVDSFAERAPVDFAEVGDLAGVPTADAFGFAVGVVCGETIMLYGPSGRFESYPRSAMTIAWKVGH